MINFRSKLAASIDSTSDEIKTGSDSVQQAASGVPADPGLALLPIITILCGVAVGLASVALGVILLVR